MQLAIVAAGYSAGEADQLRRSMAAWKRHGGLEQHRERIARPAWPNAATPPSSPSSCSSRSRASAATAFRKPTRPASRCIVYASCWLKCHEPAAFACALLNCAADGLLLRPTRSCRTRAATASRCAPVDVRHSDWDCTLEADPRVADRLARDPPRPAPGRAASARTSRGGSMAGTRAARRSPTSPTCARAPRSTTRHQALLADAGALRGLAGHRHRARWAVAGVEKQLPLFGTPVPTRSAVALPPPSAGRGHAGRLRAHRPHAWARTRWPDLRSSCARARCRDSRDVARAAARHAACASPGW